MFWIALIAIVILAGYAIIDTESDGLLTGCLIKVIFWVAVISLAVAFLRTC